VKEKTWEFKSLFLKGKGQSTPKPIFLEQIENPSIKHILYDIVEGVVLCL
jgi:hypothetical protein